MSIILGFGSTEMAREDKMHNVIYDRVKAIVGDDYGIIYEDKQKEIEDVVKAIRDECNEGYEKCDKSTPRPERYGHFYATCTFGCSDVVVIMKWIHINSQHPMSPDGMAMMQQVRFIHISSIPE